MTKSWIACLLLQLPTLAQAGDPVSPKSGAAMPAGRVSDAERYARRCQPQSAQRIARPQGTMLWGTRRDWNTEKASGEHESVLVSADLAPLRRAENGVQALRLEGGHLEASPVPQAGTAISGVVGAVLQGSASDGKPVEVAICGAEPSAEDPGMVFYRIEAWNAVAQEWENPCVAVDRDTAPRALAVSGVWDVSGAHQAVPGKFTFACQNGAITKCVLWGYKPWACRDGHSMADLHQACTRMARADYCGNGQSHTRQNTTIDIYDRLGVIQRTVTASREWDPVKATFEAAWAPDGATCIARTRDGRALETILQACPHRFQTGTVDALGEGEECAVRRADVSAGTGLLRNLTYADPQGPVSPSEGR